MGLRDRLHPIEISAAAGTVTVRAGDVELARSARALALDETGSPRRYYLPREDVRMDLLARSERTSRCPWKGQASYFGTRELPDVAWSYEEPREPAEPVRGFVAFYGDRVRIHVG